MTVSIVSMISMISRNRSDIFTILSFQTTSFHQCTGRLKVCFGFQTTYGLVAWFEYLDDVLPIHKAGKV